MTTLMIITESEWVKIFAKAKSKVLLILLSIGVIGAGIFYYLLENRLGLTFMEGRQFPIWVLELFLKFVLPLFIMVIVADVFAGEFQDGTIKNVFALPASRTTLYVAKLLAVALFVGTMLGVILGLSLLCATLVTGFSVFTGTLSILIAYIGAFIVLGVLIVLSVVISLFVGSSSLSLVLNLLLWLGMGTFGAFVPVVSNYLPTSFTHWYEPLLSGGHIRVVLPMLLYMISYYIILVVLGLMKFQKKEV
ncbi:MAG: ABC transporter permease [Vallitaleaceae bacterium]|nr:ABC transporter permease [Vallitaleaceae bacterium]